MSLDKSREGRYSVYKTLENMEVEHSSIFGSKYVSTVSKGTKIYACIDYKQLIRSHYFTRKPGMGGVPCATFQYVESNPDKFKFIGTVQYSYPAE